MCCLIAQQQYLVILGLIPFALRKVDLKYSNSKWTQRDFTEYVFKLVSIAMVHSSQQGLGLLQICSFSFSVHGCIQQRFCLLMKSPSEEWPFLYQMDDASLGGTKWELGKVKFVFTGNVLWCLVEWVLIFYCGFTKTALGRIKAEGKPLKVSHRLGTLGTLVVQK